MQLRKGSTKLGILDSLFGEPKPKRLKKSPPKVFTVNDFLTKHTHKTLKKLARNDPEALDRMIIADLETKRGWKMTSAENKDELTEWLEMRDRMAKSGLMPNDDKGWLKDIAIVAAQLLMTVQQSQRPTNGVIVTNSNANEQLPAAQTLALNPSEQEQRDMVSNYLISQFAKRTPKGAYSWLIRQQHPQMETMIQSLRQTDDSTLFTYLDVVAVKNPLLAGFIRWLKERPDWTKELVGLIRTSGLQPSSPNTGI